MLNKQEYTHPPEYDEQERELRFWKEEQFFLEVLVRQVKRLEKAIVDMDVEAYRFGMKVLQTALNDWGKPKE